MPYPAIDDIQTAATAYGAELDEIAAFAAWHGRVPRNAGEVATFQSQVNAVSPTLPHELTWDFIQAKLGPPSGAQQAQMVIDWAVANGYMLPSGAMTGNHAPSLSWYLKSVGSQLPVPSTGTTGGTPTTGGSSDVVKQLTDSFSKHPLMWAGGAGLLLLVGSGALGGRRR